MDDFGAGDHESNFRFCVLFGFRFWQGYGQVNIFTAKYAKMPPRT